MPDPQGTSAVLDQILSYPANRATIPGLVTALSLPKAVVPYVGSGMTAELGVPTWRSFLEQVANEVGVATDRPDDTLLEEIRDTAGDLFFDDRLEVVFGDHVFAS